MKRLGYLTARKRHALRKDLRWCRREFADDPKRLRECVAVSKLSRKVLKWIDKGVIQPPRRRRRK